MPGYATWKQLYCEEFRSMTDEGYDTEAALSPSDGEAPLPFPDYVNSEQVTEESERRWREAYERLWALRGNGIRADYRYDEPMGYENIISAAADCPVYGKLSEEEYRDRINGAVCGRAAGVILGKPVEMGFDRKKIREYLESVGEYPLNDWISAYSPALDLRLREDCLPSTKGNVAYVQPDDDIHYTILALLLAERKGMGFTLNDVGENWLDNVPYHWFWCASRQAYYRMVNFEDSIPREKQIAEIPYRLNPWRECIDGQIRCDAWGYYFPGNPRMAAEPAYRDCSFSLTKNGCYGGMFVAGCIAAALSEKPTVDGILDGGLSVIPVRSRLAEAVRFVREKYAECGDWERVCGMIEERYGDIPFCGTVNNLAMVVLALVHGGLDYTKTITTAVMCGIDTDCNAGTAGSICGAAVGRGGIEDRWISPLNDTVKTAILDYGTGTLSGLAERIIKIGLSNL